MPRRSAKPCEFCRQPVKPYLDGRKRQLTSRYCSPKCRTAAWRQRKAKTESAADTTWGHLVAQQVVHGDGSPQDEPAPPVASHSQPETPEAKRWGRRLVGPRKKTGAPPRWDAIESTPKPHRAGPVPGTPDKVELFKPGD